MLSLSYAGRVRKLGEMCLLAGVLAVQTVICKNKITEIISHIIAKKNEPQLWTVVDQALPHSTHTMPLSRPESFTVTVRGYLHLSGGVSVMVCAVNSSSKYRVSVSDVTCGLKSGVS